MSNREKEGGGEERSEDQLKRTAKKGRSEIIQGQHYSNDHVTVWGILGAMSPAKHKAKLIQYPSLYLEECWPIMLHRCGCNGMQIILTTHWSQDLTKPRQHHQMRCDGLTEKTTTAGHEWDHKHVAI